MPEFANGRLLATITPGQTRIDGIVGADPDLVALAGTVKEAKVVTVDDPANLERAIVEAVQSGRKVADGFVKFAQPVVIDTPRSVGQAKEAADAQAQPAASVDAGDLLGFVEAAAAVREDKDCLTKLAAHPFVDNFINKVELEKVDGREVGLRAPVKVAFKDEATKEWFLSLFDKSAAEKKAGIETLLEKLVAAGVNKAAAVEKAAKKLASRRR
jgi:hypothetical protein